LKIISFSDNHRLNIGLGVIGMLVIIAGTLLPLPTQKICYLIGGLFLLVSSILEKQLFFSLLQTVISFGALIAFAPISVFLKAASPICLSIIIIFYFIHRGLLHDRLHQIGCLGLIFIAVGYAISHPLVYFLGGLCLIIFSFGAFRRGIQLGLLWGILNAVFSFTSGVATYKSFFIK
jgi:hypothetical protein